MDVKEMLEPLIVIPKDENKSLAQSPFTMKLDSDTWRYNATSDKAERVQRLHDVLEKIGFP